ncbi:hypothetical protein QVD17_36034 [Tagetes erecta]|uniref:Exocyst subunit Exo70 family protein n=1 Tax=Tagetes erecta TaxID=13708 RepID=A0AAD8JTB6_TARER|nr:hypothetical protein QVD17_36034 [Tagetes erecta]
MSSIMEENLKRAEEVINKWKLDTGSYSRFISIFHQNNNDATCFFNSITQLHKAMHFLTQNSNDFKSSNLSTAQKLMQIAMKRLEKEFHVILLDHRAPEYVSNSSSSSSSPLSRSSIDSEEERNLQISISAVKQPSMKQTQIIAISDVQISISDVKQPTIEISNLQLIAETMISCGYGKECIGVYKITRKTIIDEALLHLGIQKYNRSHIKKMMNDPHFDHHVKNWLHAVQIAMKTVFQEEKLLCDHVFSSYTSIGNLCFKHSTKEAALNLFTFPEVIATRCKKLKSDTIFVLMDLHNSISDLWPEIEFIFSEESLSSVKLQAHSCLQKLGDSVRSFLGDLESSIQKNTSKLTVTGGGIHPLSDSVMACLSSLSDYGSALSDVIVDCLPFKEQSEQSQSLFLKSYLNCVNSDEISPAAVSVNFAWIILVLLCKLDGKAKFHNYVALSYLFLVNNLHFIIEKVRETNLRFILGDEWITNHEKKLKQYVSCYESMSWNKVISCLPESSLESPEKVKGCFRKLYFTFEEVYGNQTSWIVVDEKMRGKMKALIAKKLVPAYEKFYGKHLVTLSEDVRCMKMLMKLSPENMAKYLSELFPGTSTVLSSSWSSHALIQY